MILIIILLSLALVITTNWLLYKYFRERHLSMYAQNERLRKTYQVLRGELSEAKGELKQFREIFIRTLPNKGVSWDELVCARKAEIKAENKTKWEKEIEWRKTQFETFKTPTAKEGGE